SRACVRGGAEAARAPPFASRRVRFDCAAIAERMRPIFSAPAPGWPSARYHSPDLMIAADSIDAINADRFDVVLGELHAAVNTIGMRIRVAHHPEPALLVQAVDRDFDAPRIVPVVPKALW